MNVQKFSTLRVNLGPWRLDYLLKFHYFMFTSLFIFSTPTSLMVQWSGRGTQGHDMFCHDPDVMGSIPGQVEHGGYSSSV